MAGDIWNPILFMNLFRKFRLIEVGFMPITRFVSKREHFEKEMLVKTVLSAHEKGYFFLAILIFFYDNWFSNVVVIAIIQHPTAMYCIKHSRYLATSISIDSVSIFEVAKSRLVSDWLERKCSLNCSAKKMLISVLSFNLSILDCFKLDESASQQFWISKSDVHFDARTFCLLNVVEDY